MQTTVHRKRGHSLPFFQRGGLLFFFFFLSHLAIGQTINLSLKKASLETAFEAIERLTPYRFTYTAEVLQDTKPVTLEVTGASIEQVLTRLFEGQPLSYSINKNYVSVRHQALPVKPAESPASFPVEGLVRNDRGEPVPRATVSVKGSSLAIGTDADGHFHFPSLPVASTLTVSSIGYASREVAVGSHRTLEVTLAVQATQLDEAVVIGYGTTTRRYATGSAGRLTAAEISRQPVFNPLAALQGRIAGLNVVQSSGLPGANFNVQIRGQNSIRQGTQPLYVIDGVPLMLNSTLAQVSGLLSTTVNNPLNSINPTDIESVEVLKDADATAIYGSQGANGVILITTKKGGTGKTTVTVNAYSGFGQVARSVKLLHTDQYLQMRREAFANDGATPTLASAPDLLVWDTARYTDWAKELTGGQPHISNIQATLSGGTKTTRLFFNAGYYTETTVFPNAQPARRGSMRLNAGHQSMNNRFKADFSTMFSLENKVLPNSDLTSLVFLPPNVPSMKDSAGNLAWTPGVENPYATSLTEYKGRNHSFLGNLVLQYEVFRGVNLKTSFGYSNLFNDEQSRLPIRAQRPSATTRGTLQLGESGFASWIAEPQASYKTALGNHSFEALVGLSFQERRQKGSMLTGTQYTSDDLLGNIASAGQITASNYESQYSYTAVFGRLSYAYAHRYLLNLNARRDGSSRFGPANRFSNFGAVGAGWIITDEPFLQKRPSWLSFAKVRGSYGVTGNDQIGDYLYLDAWATAASYQYGGLNGTLPNRLYNPYFQWERNRKLEFALEIALFQSRLTLSASWYRNRSDNQLVNYKLPSQTGFTTILKNLDALLQNTGFELEMTSKNIATANFSWQSSLNVTVPRNKLIRYPGLESSSDRLSFALGEPLSVLFGYTFESVDPQTGVYVFTDVNKDNLLNATGDYHPLGAMAVNFQGGIQNAFRFKGWEADIFFQFVEQKGRNYLSNLTTRPGFMGNQPIYIMDRWQHPGDVAEIQRFTQATSNPAYAAYANFRNSSASIANASFIRLKNVLLGYSLPDQWLKKLHIGQTRVYVEGRNLLTLTSYKGSDPETQTLTSLPPLKSIVGGIQLTF